MYAIRSSYDLSRDRGIVRRIEIVEDTAGAGGSNPFRAEDVLERDGDAVQRAPGVPARKLFVAGSRLPHGGLRENRDIAVDLRVDPFSYNFV